MPKLISPKLLLDGEDFLPKHGSFSGEGIEKTYEFRDDEKDADKWMEKFKDYYNRGSYVYTDRNNSNRYYLKIEDTWYMMYNSLKETPQNLKELYPLKKKKPQE